MTEKETIQSFLSELRRVPGLHDLQYTPFVAQSLMTFLTYFDDLYAAQEFGVKATYDIRECFHDYISWLLIEKGTWLRDECFDALAFVLCLPRLDANGVKKRSPFVTWISGDRNYYCDAEYRLSRAIRDLGPGDEVRAKNRVLKWYHYYDGLQWLTDVETPRDRKTCGEPATKNERNVTRYIDIEREVVKIRDNKSPDRDGTRRNHYYWEYVKFSGMKMTLEQLPVIKDFRTARERGEDKLKIWLQENAPMVVYRSGLMVAMSRGERPTDFSRR